VQHGDFFVNLIGEVLQFILPKPVPIAVAAATISGYDYFIGCIVM
jgi:hypothetical protein